MKVLIASITVILSLAVCTATALGAGEDKKKGGGEGGPNMSGQGNQSQNSGSSNKQSINPENRGTANRGSTNRNDNKMGDSNWDKNGIGSMDESKHKDDKDNKWRYQHMGKDWWYWMPGGYWDYYRYGRWNRYNVDTYVDMSPAPSNGSANGPYYEDQNGFYYLNGNRKVYDPQIQRVASPGGSGPTAPQG
jgi:hypothetical protein